MDVGIINRENLLYNSKPQQKKNRAERNKARAMMAAKGKVHKGDGKDIAHKKALSKSGLNVLSNLSVQSASENRSFARTKTSKLKSETSKREKK